MLELKGIEVEDVRVLPGMQRIHLRLAGFRGGTVLALKLDGRRVQGSREIARALEELQPEPSLFPTDPERRSLAEEAERWGEEELQNVPRRIFRWGLVHHTELRRWLSAVSGLPAPGLAARLSGLNARYYANAVKADEQAVRRDLDRSRPSRLVDGHLASDQLTRCGISQLLAFVNRQVDLSGSARTSFARIGEPPRRVRGPTFASPSGSSRLASATRRLLVVQHRSVCQPVRARAWRVRAASVSAPHDSSRARPSV